MARVDHIKDFVVFHGNTWSSTTNITFDYLVSRTTTITTITPITNALLSGSIDCRLADGLRKKRSHWDA
ncbi:MAG: hypothetical protein K9M57_03150 [Phycisphaerae bacterium]|nr:hypothetical protein [Phycisphaerae bacterium]